MNRSFTSAANLERDGRGTLVIIGNFDGVHRGHRALLAAAVARANAERLVPAVLTFHPHPLIVLGREAPPTLTPLARKAVLLAETAPELRVVVETFDHELAAMTPEVFAHDVLATKLAARAVVVGQNFRFGRGRAGDFNVLRDLGKKLGFEVWAEPLVGDEKGPWSSTRARAAIASGDLAEANDVLGRPYELEGVVVAGDRRGRTIGFPTANLARVEEAVPAFGVYAVIAEHVAEAGGPGERIAGGVANIGERPTVAAGFSIEAHLFDFDGDLYGTRVRLRLVERLREERKFEGVEALVRQIRGDVARARSRLEAVALPRR